MTKPPQRRTGTLKPSTGGARKTQAGAAKTATTQAPKAAKAPAAKKAVTAPAAKAAKAPTAKPARAPAVKAQAPKPTQAQAAKPAKAAAKPATAKAAKAAAPAKSAAPAATGSTTASREPAPGFTLPASGGRQVSLAAMKGKPFVLYFYPKADTPGCTVEACAFNEALTQFKALSIDVIGVSKDELPAIEAFAAKFGLAFPLASDPSNATAQAYGAWGPGMYGKVGLIRSTFLIDKDGKIAKAWKRVKVDGHAAAVLEAAKAL